MEIWPVLLDVLVLLGAGALLGGLLERMGQSALIGYLLAGAVLGPNGLALIHGGQQVFALSELGVALLLFAIGLEFSWSRLRAMGGAAFGGGALQVLFTGLLGALVGHAAGLSPGAGFGLGAILAPSSTACVLRLLSARGEVESVYGRRALGILLFQDIAVVPLVLFVSVLSEGGTPAALMSGVLRTLTVSAGLVAVLYLVFNRIVPRLLQAGHIHGNRELSLLLAVVSGLGSGVAAHSVGVSPALGAFVAGMILADSPLAVQVRADVSSLKTLLMTLFFTSMGMLANPQWMAEHAGLVLGTLAAVLLGKTLVVWLALRLFGARDQSAFASGLCLAQIGEFSFVLAELGRGKLFTEDLFLLMVSTAVLTMLLTPYLVSAAPRLAARATAPRRPFTLLKNELPKEPGAGAPVVLIIGFGPAGRAAAERVADAGAGLVVIDQNPSSTRDARSLGYTAVDGDARHVEVLEHASIRNATHVLVTLPGPETAAQVVRYVRLVAPQVQILARSRFHRTLGLLSAAGAHTLIDEEYESGRLLAEAWAEQHTAPHEAAA